MELKIDIEALADVIEETCLDLELYPESLNLEKNSGVWVHKAWGFVFDITFEKENNAFVINGYEHNIPDDHNPNTYLPTLLCRYLNVMRPAPYQGN